MVSLAGLSYRIEKMAWTVIVVILYTATADADNNGQFVKYLTLNSVTIPSVYIRLVNCFVFRYTDTVVCIFS